MPIDGDDTVVVGEISGGASSLKKRWPPSAGARGVANLTPEQLQKKRQHDREAQRAIRERTKKQIETLEKMVRDLTSQQPYRELQLALQQKEAVEAENAHMKRRLESVLAMIQAVLGQHQQQHALLDTPHSPPLHTTHDVNKPGASSYVNALTPSSISSPGLSVGTAQWPAAPMAADGGFSLPLLAFHQPRQDHVHGLNAGLEGLGLDLDFLLDGTPVYRPAPMMEFGMPAAADSGAGGASWMDCVAASAGTNTSSGTSTGTEMVGHAMPCRNCPATCPLDGILLDFLRERQQQAAWGVAMPELVGPLYPSVSSLLDPVRGAQAHPLSKLLTDILATFPDLATLPERVAVLYVMFLVMRWTISPTPENYARLPGWARPRPLQLVAPHPAWVDHVPFPRMRDRLVRVHARPEYHFNNFFVPFTATLSLNWPYEPADVLLPAATDGDELLINPVFERHVRRLENWTLGPAFAAAFPGLADTFGLEIEGAQG